VKRLSLRARLLLGVVVLAAVGLVAADAATYASLRSFLLTRVDKGLEAAHPEVEGAAFGGGRPNAVGRGPGPPAAGINWYQLRTLDGRVVRGGFLVGGGSPPKLGPTIAVAASPNRDNGERASYFTVGAVRGSTSYRVRASVEPQHPGFVLLVATSLNDVAGTLHRLILIEVLATLAVLGGMIALGLWLVRLGLRPLREIEATARAITGGDLSPRVEVADERTEVGRVGRALNTMLDRIETSDSRLRRFVADASHELRTPLAAIRAYAELFGRGAATKPEDLARSMAGIGRESERMSLLVEDLLLLARLDEGRPLEQEPVALADVVAEAVDAARAVEPARPYAVEVEEATVIGDRDRLRQIVDNLLANVRSHTSPETAVRVALRRLDGNAEITVADDGPGLTEDELDQVFDRFYRADASRARASGGAGLGLSIVAAVARAHGGEVSARSQPGEGATFVIDLPLA
jgi:two-component system OmpR family sensor kinase